jgi:diaminopimelate decarboxylase
MAADVQDARDEQLREVAERFGTPAYVFFGPAIEARAAAITKAFGGRFVLSYAVKSNPNPGLLSFLRERIPLLDVSSIGEFRHGMRAGYAPSRVSFTGPGKRDFELQEAIAGNLGELVIESLREAEHASVIAESLGKTQDVLVRVAPSRVPKGFGDHMAGRPSAFGVDVEVIHDVLPRIVALPGLRVVGLHIYSGTQCLKPAALCENYRNFMSVFREVCERHALTPKKLVFGSGLGIPYHDGDTPLDLAAVAADINPDLDAFKAEPRFAGAQLILELGRYLVGEAGVFLTRVITVKESRGSRIGICDGGMNNHLPASGHFGMVIHRNYSMHKVGGAVGTATGGTSNVEKVDLVGPLCTSIDRLAQGVMLPRVEEGDLIAVHGSGAYGLSASPILFISHPPPREILATAQGLHDVTRALSDFGEASPAAR